MTSEYIHGLWKIIIAAVHLITLCSIVDPASDFSKRIVKVNVMAFKLITTENKI